MISLNYSEMNEQPTGMQREILRFVLGCFVVTSTNGCQFKLLLQSSLLRNLPASTLLGNNNVRREDYMQLCRVCVWGVPHDWSWIFDRELKCRHARRRNVRPALDPQVRERQRENFWRCMVCWGKGRLGGTAFHWSGMSTVGRRGMSYVQQPLES